MSNKNENRCHATEQLNKHLADEDRNAELLEEFQSLSLPYLVKIEEAMSHINNFADSYEDIDLDDEISDMLSEILFPSISHNKIKELRKLTEELKEVLK